MAVGSGETAMRLQSGNLALSFDESRASRIDSTSRGACHRTVIEFRNVNCGGRDMNRGGRARDDQDAGRGVKLPARKQRRRVETYCVRSKDPYDDQGLVVRGFFKRTHIAIRMAQMWRARKHTGVEVELVHEFTEYVK